MKRSKQLPLFPEKMRRQYALTAASKSFGGSDMVGKRKVARPLATNRPLHLVLKSSQARGRLTFLNHRTALDQVLRRISRKWGVQIKNRVWVSNHIHMTVQFSNRMHYQNWIRELTGQIVCCLSQRVRQRIANFFDHRPWTRVLEWGRDLLNMKDYFLKNELQNFGLRRWAKNGIGIGKPNMSPGKPDPLAESFKGLICSSVQINCSEGVYP